MIIKNINGRIQHKHDIEENWLKATNFIPLIGELIVYDPDSSHTDARLKIGDGQTLVNDLPFATVDTISWNDLVDKPTFVSTVNGVGPDINGNIEIEAGGGEVEGITSTANKIIMDRPLEITTTEKTEIIEPGYTCVVDWNNSVANVILTDGEQYAVNGGLYLEIPYLTDYGEASNIVFIPVGGSFSIYEPDYGYDCNFYLRSYTNLEIDGYMMVMYESQTIKIVKKQLAGTIVIDTSKFDAINATIAALENKVIKLEAKLSFNGSDTTLGNIFMTDYDLSEKTISVISCGSTGYYDEYVGTLALSNGFEIRVHAGYYPRVDIYCPYDGSTTTIYDVYGGINDSYTFTSGCQSESIKLAYYNESGSMEWERGCTAAELDSTVGCRISIAGGSLSEEQKNEIHDYVDEVILGGEW